MPSLAAQDLMQLQRVSFVSSGAASSYIML